MSAATNIETLPSLEGSYALTGSEIADYRKNGHALLRGAASPEEISVYRKAINDAAYRYNTETRSLEERDTYGKAFLQVMNLWVKDEAVRRFTMARRFAKIAAELMAVESVRIYHDQALFKEPGGGHTPWHQDQHYWPLATDQTITLWMPLMDVPAEMGTMNFASGSNSTGYLGDLPISDQSDMAFESFIQERGYTKMTYGAMSAGDATYHSGWTLHGAPGNPGSVTREVMTIIYFAADARVGEIDNKNRQDDLDRWLPGCKPGDLAASPLNPVAYP